MSANELPALPDEGYLGDDASYGYDRVDMREYGLACIAAAQARIEALELDARRYRWLMENYSRGVGFHTIDDVLNQGDVDGHLDAAIDAELSKENRP